jgi:hypothetical protein
MGTVELANFFASTLTAGVLTVWGAKIKNAQALQQMQMEVFQAQAGIKKAALEFKSDAGFHFTRRAIAMLVVTTLVCGSVLLPVIADAPVAVGYIKSVSSFWAGDTTAIEWIAADPGTIMISPVHNNMGISIIGMFFGNQFVK